MIKRKSPITFSIILEETLNDWLDIEASKYKRSKISHIEYILEQWREQWEVKTDEPEGMEKF